jgi:DNA-binding transcriptional ArsR family regulator
MDGGDDEAQGLQPAAAFALLSNDLRVDILQALLDLQREGERCPASFSTLRAAAGIEVSAQFSYHLDELTGHFLRKTDEGYEFRYAGWKVVTAILAGTYTDRDAFGPAAVGGTCPVCDTDALEATYREEWLRVDCRHCGTRLTRYPFPPGGLAGRTTTAFLRAFDQHVRAHLRLARAGVCPACRGPMASAVRGSAEAGRLVECNCSRCGNSLHPRVGTFFLDDPAVQSFLRERDPGFESRPFWEFECCVTDAPTVVSTDPWRARLELVRDGDALTVEFDADLSVVDADVSEA